MILRKRLCSEAVWHVRLAVAVFWLHLIVGKEMSVIN